MRHELGAATHVYVEYRDRGVLAHDEVLCRACYAEMEQRGCFDPGERHARLRITVKPWSGEPQCSSCDPSALDADDHASTNFVPPHRCEGCGHNTDVDPCHRCGHRGASAARVSS